MGTVKGVMFILLRAGVNLIGEHIDYSGGYVAVRPDHGNLWSCQKKRG